MADDKVDVITIRKRLSYSPFRVEHKKQIGENFTKNPFAAYAKLLEDTYSYRQFSENQEFLAVIVEEIIITERQSLPEFLASSLAIYNNYSAINKYYKILIPALDEHIPNLKLQKIGDVFLNESARFAICEDAVMSSKIVAGSSIVRVSDAILATKLKKPCIIRSVLSSDTFEKEEDVVKTLRDAYEACIKGLAIIPPDEEIPPKSPTVPVKALFGGKKIYSKIDVNAQNLPPRSDSFIKPPDEPTPSPPDADKDRTISKVNPSADDLSSACELGPTESPKKPEKTAENEINNDCFVRNGKTAVLTQKLENINVNFYNSLSILPTKKVLTASKTLDSIGPVYDLPEEFREPSMIVIKTAVFESAEKYYDKIESDKIAAAHFCIDLNGEIFQFTDTKNLVKSYNPIIDEKAIYIAVINIPFRNSSQTVSAMKFRNSLNSLSSPRPNFTFSGAAQAAELAKNISRDKSRLEDFYKSKGYPTSYVYEEYPSQPRIGENIKTFFLEDGRDTFPYYRFDYSSQQKLSLTSLTNALLKSYNNIEKKVPKTYGFDVEVASGDFSGIAAPMHFTLSEMEPLNFFDIAKNFNYWQ